MQPPDASPSEGRSDADNALSGTVHGPSLQAASIQGNVYFGTTAGPRSALRPGTPMQLPPRPRHFTNRVESLAALDGAFAAALTDGAPALALISGPPGVGKTSLALSWLHLHGSDFPDGQLYTDLEGHRTAGSEQPVAPSTILPSFLHALGVPPDQVPADLAGQTALFRTVTAGRRVAVLCDNALSAAQVRPLIPASPGSVCVVTSRWRLTSLLIDGAAIEQLDPLEMDSALELLGRIAGRERIAADIAAARELVTSCGRFPLAVCVGAALLAIRPGWSVAATAASLFTGLSASAEYEEVSMNASLDQVYAALPPETASLYRRMGLHPGAEFDMAVAAAAAAAHPQILVPAELLAMLASANLLTEVRPGRYRFHDLIHHHARGQAEADDPAELREETTRRIIDYYLATANSADQIVYPQRRRPEARYTFPPPAPSTFPDFATALGWFDAERGNLMAAQRLSLELPYLSATWQIADAVWPLFSHLRYHGDWIASYEIGADAARDCGHRLGEARLRTGLGVALRDAGRLSEALAVLDEALALRREIGDRRGEALVLHHLGMVHQERGDLDRAGSLFRTALAIRETEGDIRGVARDHSAIGEVESLSGRHVEAVAHLTSGLRMVAGTGDHYELVIRRLLGQACLRADDRSAARSHLVAALDLLRDAGTVFEEGTVRELLGELAEQEGDLDSAQDQYARAESVYTQLGAVPAAHSAAGHRHRLTPDPDTEPSPGDA
jgi:tetratricopeptide (TPR) repeat protein